MAAFLERAKREGLALGLDDEELLAWAGARIDSPDELERLHAGDLALACATVKQLPRALSAFDRLLRVVVQRTLNRSLAQSAPDVLGLAWERLAVGGQPRLADYTGRGALPAWLAVVVRRLALDHHRSEQRRTQHEQALSPPTPSSADADLELLRRDHRAAFNAAFREALADLDDGERELLRFAVEGLGIDAIAARRGIGRSTAARHLAATRLRLLEATRDRLLAQARLGEATLEVLLPSLGKDLDISLRTILGA